MVTKGYQKGVYDWVTEGTWEKEPGREPRGFVEGHFGTGPMDRQIRENERDLRGGLSAGHGGEYKNEESQERRPGKTPQNMPNHDAHGPNPPRGGNRE
jgi:hypothetical protein